MNPTLLTLFLFCGVFSHFINGCASLEPMGRAIRKAKIPSEWAYRESGWASFYHQALVGRKTANGEQFSNELLTAAHPSLPFGTIVMVRRSATGRYVFVRINDRGPFVAGRVIDLSRAAAAKIGLLAAGVGRVELFIIPADHPLIAHL